MPNQKTGNATKMDVLNVTSMSQNEYRLTADSIPARMPKHRLDEDGHDSELEGVGELVPEDGRHRALQLVRLAQVSLEKVLHPPHVLVRDGAVERILLDDLVVERRGDGSLSGDELHRVARENARGPQNEEQVW